MQFEIEEYKAATRNIKYLIEQERLIIDHHSFTIDVRDPIDGRWRVVNRVNVSIDSENKCLIKYVDSIDIRNFETELQYNSYLYQRSVEVYKYLKKLNSDIPDINSLLKDIDIKYNNKNITTLNTENTTTSKSHIGITNLCSKFDLTDGNTKYAELTFPISLGYETGSVTENKNNEEIMESIDELKSIVTQYMEKPTTWQVMVDYVKQVLGKITKYKMKGNR